MKPQIKPDIEAVKKAYAEKAKSLKQQEQEAIKQAKAKAAKIEAAERAELRKADAHIKIVIGGYILSGLKNGSIERDLLSKIIATLKSEKDKVLFTKLKAAMPALSVKKP